MLLWEQELLLKSSCDCRWVFLTPTLPAPPLTCSACPQVLQVRHKWDGNSELHLGSSAVPTGKRQLCGERQKVAENIWKSFSSWRIPAIFRCRVCSAEDIHSCGGAPPHTKGFQCCSSRLSTGSGSSTFLSERTGGSLGHRGTKALAKATLKMKVITRTKAQGHSFYSSASTRAAGEQKTADTGISKLKVSP